LALGRGGGRSIGPRFLLVPRRLWLAANDLGVGVAVGRQNLGHVLDLTEIKKVFSVFTHGNLPVICFYMIIQIPIYPDFPIFTGNLPDF
jgi:hypothetical protein